MNFHEMSGKGRLLNNYNVLDFGGDMDPQPGTEIFLNCLTYETC